MTARWKPEVPHGVGGFLVQVFNNIQDGDEVPVTITAGLEKLAGGGSDPSGSPTEAPTSSSTSSGDASPSSTSSGGAAMPMVTGAANIAIAAAGAGVVAMMNL